MEQYIVVKLLSSDRKRHTNLLYVYYIYIHIYIHAIMEQYCYILCKYYNIYVVYIYYTYRKEL